MKCNTAVFYDIKSLMVSLGDKEQIGVNLDELHSTIRTLKGVDGVSIQRAYADWSEPANRELWGLVLQVGIDPVQVFALSPGEEAKDVANINLVIDAVDLIGRSPEIVNYVIASDDNIFTFLVKKLREHGKYVIGCGFEGNTGEIFHKAVNEFISLGRAESSMKDALVVPIKPSKRGRTKATLSDQIGKEQTVSHDEEQPVVKVRKRRRLSEKKPTRFPDNEFSINLFESDVAIVRDGAITDLHECLHTVKEIVRALFSKPTKDSASVSLKDFIIYMKHYIRGFKITDHGFKRIEAFMKFMLSGSPYCMYTVDDITYIAPRRKVKDDTITDDVKSLSVTSTNDGKRYSSIFDVPTGVPFTFAYSDSKKPRSPRPGGEGPHNGRSGRKKVAPTHNIDLQVPLRSWAKEQFNLLSKSDGLSLSEVRKLKDLTYSKDTFGISAPCFLEIETSRNMDEQRTVDGKIRYWKDIFRFNGRTYLIYKDWVNGTHKDRFLNWIDSLNK